MAERTWEDMVAEAIAEGYAVHCPNGLPIKCIGRMMLLEHEHGDHPTYMFPVEVEYIGPISEGMRSDYEMMCEAPPVCDSDVQDFFTEIHALIYADDNVALTLYECNYAMFSLHSGLGIAGRYVNSQRKLTPEALNNIRARKI
ncbi:MAG: hypothetical protein JWO15_3551 [Sphingomonadales bacterium]|nr:hypothetical protein [Sphingomonadales bacterium]